MIPPTLHESFPCLTTLVLSFKHTDADSLGFFKPCHFPALQEFSLATWPLWPDAERTFVRFLERHAPTLAVLHLFLNIRLSADESDLRLPLETLHVSPPSLWALAPAVRGTVVTLRIARCIHLFLPCTCRTLPAQASGIVGPWPSVRRLAMDACLRVASGRELVPTGGSMMDFPIEIQRLGDTFPNLETLRIEAASDVSGSSG